MAEVQGVDTSAVVAELPKDSGVTVVTTIKSPRSPISKGALEIAAIDPTVAQAAMEARMAHVARLVSKVGESWAPWKASKNKARSSQAVADLEGLRAAVRQQMNYIARLERNNVEHEQLRAKSASQLEAIQRLKTQINELQEFRAEKSQAVSHMLNKVEGVAGAPKRYLKLDEKKEAELLQTRLEGLLKEHEKLRAENDKLAHAKADLAKRIAEMNNKTRDDAEIRDREMRRVNTEIKKANDTKEAAIAAARSEAAEQLAARGREFKSLQKRMETMKAELDVLKGREQTIKKEADQASIAASKSQQEAKVAIRKAVEARAEKDEVAHQLVVSREEMSMIASEYAQAYSAVCKEAAIKPTYQPSAAIKDNGIGFPRQAFTVRGSSVLHSCACGRVDLTKMEAREYHSIKQLESWVNEGSVVLCTECRGSGF